MHSSQISTVPKKEIRDWLLNYLLVLSEPKGSSIGKMEIDSSVKTLSNVEREKRSWETNPKQEEESLRTILYSHMENSSAHGVPNIQRSSRPITKLTWTLLFLAGIGIITWQVGTLFQKYFEWNYTVKLEVRFNRTQSFPAITICNMNLVTKSKLETKDESFQERFENNHISDGALFSTPTTPDTGNGTRQNESNPETIDISEVVRDWSSRILPPLFYHRKSEDYGRQRNRVVALANTSLEERVFLGHSLDDMLLDCKWKGIPCSPENFTTFYDSRLGNCYIFNSGRKGDEVTTHRTGADYGLSLELFVQQDEYVEGMTEVAGFRVKVHHTSTMPFPADDGILVSPGFSTSIGIRVLKIDRLPKPYGKCKADLTKDIEDDVYHQNYGVKYNRKTCEVSCYQNEVINKCSCFDPSFPNSLNTNHTVYPCAYINRVETQCMAHVEMKHFRGELECNCPIACNDIQYLSRVSSSIWPSDAYESTLFKKMALYNAEMRTQVRGENASDWTRRNVAKLEIYYDEFNYEYIRQDPLYTIPDLLSDIGGQLGLWLGISVITVFEFFEGAWLLLAFFFRRSGQKNQIDVSLRTK